MRRLSSLLPSVTGLARPARPACALLCQHHARPLSTTQAASAGHNKWSKIRHRKGAADIQKGIMRVQHSKMITLQSRLHGPDSAQTAAAVTAAKKAGVPKNVIEGAIARGQGRSAMGTALDALTLEVIMPPGVALIVDVETDNRLRSLEDLKHLVKTHKGRVGSSAAFLFTRRGRVVFDASGDPSPSLDDVMEDAIEAGAEDLDTDADGNVVVWTQPNMTTAAMESLAPRFGGRVLSSEIVWDPNEETKVKVDAAGDAQTLGDLVAALQEYPEVQAVYANAAKGTISDEEWSWVENSLDS
ncbi:hypothetical protein ACRALDRAFT_2112624 [Sodiomyces alcalophilus JCM 7366]|uniref:uncharacterized protein n=1 Tax=Sodiomyces alcalophilus JCM 7366 TaxID=591952 RepID=UPI0039B3F149